MAHEIAGLLPPMMTPFHSDEEIDEQALRAEIRYLLAAGANGLTLSGSSGEGETMTLEEACRLASIAVDEVNGEVPVIMGIVQDSTRAVIRYGRALKETAGVTALQITPVHYSHVPDGDGTVKYYEQIGNAVEMPIVVYNVIRWNVIEVPTLLRLADLEWVKAVKQSAGDIQKLALLLQQVHEHAKSLRVLSAIDSLLLPTFLWGAHGSVAATATILPNLTRVLWDACAAGDLSRALDAHERILPLMDYLLSTNVNGRNRMRAAIELQGRRVGLARRPEQPISSEIRDEIKRLLEHSGELSFVAVSA
jgi:4-hydroxy-tetrahydrodipicolinate synthase